MKKTIMMLAALLTSFYSLASDSWEGKSAPNFDLPDQHGKFHTLKDYQDKWIVLYFYPKDDTPGCTTEAQNFTSDYATIQDMGAVLLGSSLDDIESHKEFAEKYNIPFTLLADKDEVMATAYNVVKKIPLMHYAKRQTFIINPDGIVAKFYEEVSPSDHSKEVIADLKTLQKQYKKS